MQVKVTLIMGEKGCDTHNFKGYQAAKKAMHKSFGVDLSPLEVVAVFLLYLCLRRHEDDFTWFWFRF